MEHVSAELRAAIERARSVGLEVCAFAPHLEDGTGPMCLAARGRHVSLHVGAHPEQAVEALQLTVAHYVLGHFGPHTPERLIRYATHPETEALLPLGVYATTTMQAARRLPRLLPERSPELHHALDGNVQRPVQARDGDESER